MSQTIKCISIWQPWASLCVIPHPRNPWGSVKRYETRSWPTPYRGPLLIHAAKRFTREQKACCLEEPIRSGRSAWDIVRPVMFEQPISYRGQQGLFDVPWMLVTQPSSRTDHSTI